MLYRLATEKDIPRLAELIWEHRNEDSPLDPSWKQEYIQICSEHMKHRLGDDYHCWVAADDGLIISHTNFPSRET